MAEADCLFCKIRDKKIPAAVIHREWQSGGDCAKVAITGEHRAVATSSLRAGGPSPARLSIPA